MKKVPFRVTTLVVTLLLFSTVTQQAFAYSVLTHQAIIDAVWDDSIKPLLLKRYPASTAEQLREARAYTYGGGIIQDMGYYPLGSKFFTDLAHYVRAGDFIEAMIAEARDLNEYAFALGALAHYSADNHGHSKGTNRAVPVEYPKLRQKFGHEVTYADHPASHIKVEFGFDVVQVARGKYAPDAYHDFIGFKVSKPVLERAFKITYGLEMKDIFNDLDMAIGTYRRTVGGLIPEVTKVAWQTKKDEIEKNTPGITQDKFVYSLTRSDYEKEWGRDYDKPGVLARTLAVLIRIVPKVGPFKALAFKPSSAEAERLFIESLNATLASYRELLARANNNSLELENLDFDTGRPTRPGEYKLADRAYARLLRELADDKFANVSPALRENILAFYSVPGAPNASKSRSEQRDTLRALDELKNCRACAAGSAGATDPSRSRFR